MTREILIILLLSFVAFESSGQDLKSVLKQQNLYNQISSSEEWTYSEVDSANIAGQTIDTLFSPYPSIEPRG